MHAETGGVERDGQNGPDSVALAHRCDYLLVRERATGRLAFIRYDTYMNTAVDIWYQFPPGRRTEGGNFVVTYVLCMRCVVTYALGVRCVVYVKELGETYMALDTRQMCFVAAVPAAAAVEVDKKQERKKAGELKNVEI